MHLWCYQSGTYGCSRRCLQACSTLCEALCMTVSCNDSERIIVLLSASPEGEARLPMPKGMAYKE
jgi:hypothetical protein